jgi:inosine-uridine nucleoside N-ribohydrolase
MAAQAVVIDCDPGHDDFLAILLAQRFAELRGITTVAGNSSVANTTRNACIAADMCGFSALSWPERPGRCSASRSSPSMCTAPAGSTARNCLP